MTFNSDRMYCQCGAWFKHAVTESRHRHNFPFFCRKKKPKKKDKKHAV